MKKLDGREQTLTDQAYARLEERIVTQDLAPGALLSEIALSQELNIGRTPVREALQRLSSDGLVNILPRRGIMVSEINVGSQLRMLEVRRGIELVLARSAALRAKPAEVEKFKALARDFRKSANDNDDILFMRIDAEFNDLLVETARNEFAKKAIRLVSGLSRRFFYAYYKNLDDLKRTSNLHADIAQSIAERDVDAAGEASNMLMDHIVALTRDAMRY